MSAPIANPMRITVLPGDGIGPEVTAEAVVVLQAVVRLGGRQVQMTHARIGGDALDHAGEPLPLETLAACRASDAVLLGAVGGPAWDGTEVARRPEAGLLQLRQALGLYANIRPVQCHPALVDASPLRPGRVAGADMVIYRELGGGIYYGRPRFTEPLADGTGERAVDTMTYTTGEVERLARLGFEAARRRRGLVTSIDKANVLDCSRLWRRTVTRLSLDYPDVRLEHAYVDSSTMDLVSRPTHFDVIVTSNMFGDILSDLAACIGGSLGMLPSASLGTGGALYEPVHGSAPDIAGHGRANPIAAILSVAMMCELSLNWPEAAAAIRRAVDDVLAAGYRTADLVDSTGTAGGVSEEKVLGTALMGEKIRERLAEAWPQA